MKLKLDPHPFSRGGSIAIISICAMHIMQASLLLYSPAAGNATSMKALLLTILALGIPGNDRALSYTMIITALLALYGAMFRVGKIRLAVFIPQHLMLGVMAIGGLWAAAHGAYLDGTAMPWVHILADQLGIVALFVVHTSAIIRRAQDPNG